MNENTIEDFWSKEEERKFKRLKEEGDSNELSSFIVDLMKKYNLKITANFDIVKAVKEGRRK